MPAETNLYLNTQLELAFAIALEAHRSQVCKSGIPYIVHIAGVLSNLDNLFADATMHERIVAVLHDVIEDSSITARSLMLRGIDPIIVGDVVTMTHVVGESYTDYVLRVSQRQATRRVKLADLRHNLHPNRQVDQTFKGGERRVKYNEAVKLLEDIENGRKVNSNT